MAKPGNVPPNEQFPSPTQLAQTICNVLTSQSNNKPIQVAGVSGLFVPDGGFAKADVAGKAGRTVTAWTFLSAEAMKERLFEDGREGFANRIRTDLEGHEDCPADRVEECVADDLDQLRHVVFRTSRWAMNQSNHLKVWVIPTALSLYSTESDLIAEELVRTRAPLRPPSLVPLTRFRPSTRRSSWSSLAALPSASGSAPTTRRS